MMGVVFIMTFPCVSWFSLLAVILVGYARCARLSGVPLKAAFRPCWAVAGLWPLVGMAIPLAVDLVPQWNPQVSMVLMTSAPGAAALFLLCYLRERAVKDVPLSLEVLLVVVASGLGFAISYVIEYHIVRPMYIYPLC